MVIWYIMYVDNAYVKMILFLISNDMMMLIMIIMITDNDNVNNAKSNVLASSMMW